MRDATLRDSKATLRNWFGNQDDAYLTRVVDECRAGTFAYSLPCHCLRGLCDGGYAGWAANQDDALVAERALRYLQYNRYSDCDHIGRARVLPMVLAEIKRRRVEIPADVAGLEARAGRVNTPS